MAGRLIVFKNENQTIKGECEAEGYKDYLELSSLSFVTTAYTQADSETGTVHQSSVSIVLPFGPWIAEFQQRLYHSVMLGDVEITEIEQKVDAADKKAWKKVREIHLMDGWIESLSHGWHGISQSSALTIQYTDMTFAVADKIAHYNRSEKTS
jgi:hypothetical protein